MSKTGPRFLLGAVLFASGALTSEACGPSFPMMLTTCRSTCLAHVMSPLFAEDVRGIIDEAGLRPARSSGKAAQGPASMADFEAAEGDPAERASIARMRGQSSGQAAYDAGAGLPEAVRLYVAGAVEFRQVHRYVAEGESAFDAPATPPQDRSRIDEGLGRAAAWFEKVLALPDAATGPRAIFARYMLGRAHQLRHQAGDDPAAVSDFQQVIALVESGRDDPLGLAHASLGQLGRLALDRQDFGGAISLYLRQSEPADDNYGAINSLWWVAGKVFARKEAIDALIGDPTAQKLLISYVLAFSDSTCQKEDRSCGGESRVFYTLAAPRAAVLLDALRSLPADRVQWPDRVAAIALASGDFAFAERLLQGRSSIYADWMHAKIQLHAGDIEAATQSMARAIEADRTDRHAKEAMNEEMSSRLRHEHAVLRLHKAEYAEALFQLSSSERYYDDAAYVAERVLDIDELRKIVDSSAWAQRFRDILARRLVRANRIDDAIGYFPDAKNADLARRLGSLQQLALDPKGSRPERARAWYGIARLEIESGMALRGTELCPDFSEYDGSLGENCGYRPESRDPIVSADERARVAASAALPDRRFHYRGIGVQHLFQAADLLPAHTAVMSAVLCNGVAWLQAHGRSANEDLIASAYQRYLADGSVETWTANFGAHCPEPDFSGLR